MNRRRSVLPSFVVSQPVTENRGRSRKRIDFSNQATVQHPNGNNQLVSSTPLPPGHQNSSQFGLTSSVSDVSAITTYAEASLSTSSSSLSDDRQFDPKQRAVTQSAALRSLYLNEIATKATKSLETTALKEITTIWEQNQVMAAEVRIVDERRESLLAMLSAIKCLDLLDGLVGRIIRALEEIEDVLRKVDQQIVNGTSKVYLYGLVEGMERRFKRLLEMFDQAESHHRIDNELMMVEQLITGNGEVALLSLELLDQLDVAQADLSKLSQRIEQTEKYESRI